MMIRNLRLYGAVINIALIVSTPLFASTATGGAFHADSHYDQSRTSKKKKRVVRKRPKINIQQKEVPTGQWGGTGINLIVGGDSSEIGYDCASGEITEKLKIDGSGNFRASGVHIRRRPGPEREDDPPARQPATYTGHVSGDTMSLKVVLSADGTTIGNYQLERGKIGRLRRCL